jgi:type IV secretion system protein VirB1
MAPTTFLALALSCAPQIDPGLAHALVAVESGFNPHAIGVVGASLVHQPRSGAQAMATARALQRNGTDFSVGLGQINVRNFARLGLSMAAAFDPCRNLGAMQAVLADCYARAPSRTARQTALRQALSCYYSGDFRTGFAHGYVRKVVRATAAAPAASLHTHPAATARPPEPRR